MLHSPPKAVNDNFATVPSPAIGLTPPPLTINAPAERDAAIDMQDPEVQTMNAMRFNILETQIPTSILPEARHVLENVPSTDRYEAAKKALIQHFEESQRSRLHRLLADMNLGDRKPSQLLAEMRRTANGAMTDLMLVDLWIGRLPPYVQSAVLPATKDSEDKIKVADAVMDSFALYHRTGPYQSVSEVRNGEVELLTHQVNQLSQRLEEGRRTVGNLRQTNRWEHSRPRSQFRPRHWANSTARNPDFEICSFHGRRQGNSTPSPSS
uniref:Uncharacterized protein n=1 Tax=Anopheles funestus TaxID=62324 RepID=A0A182R9D1_ANOFN